MSAETLRRPVFPSFDVRRPAVEEPPPEPDPRVLLEAELARVSRKAWDEGAREGRAAALAESREHLDALGCALEGAAHALTQERERLASELDRRLPAIVFGLVRRILGRELSQGTVGPAAIMHALAAELAGAGDESVTLRLDARAGAAFEAWRAGAAGLAAVRVEIDRSLAPGDWMIETCDALVDGRGESQIDEAWRRLVEDDA